MTRETQSQLDNGVNSEVLDPEQRRQLAAWHLDHRH